MFFEWSYTFQEKATLNVLFTLETWLQQLDAKVIKNILCVIMLSYNCNSHASQVTE